MINFFKFSSDVSGKKTIETNEKDKEILHSNNAFSGKDLSKYPGEASKYAHKAVTVRSGKDHINYSDEKF